MKPLNKTILVVVITMSLGKVCYGQWLNSTHGIYYSEGNVGIGIHPNASDKLLVNGTLKADILKINSLSFNDNLVIGNNILTSDGSQIGINTSSYASGAKLTVRGVTFFGDSTSLMQNNTDPQFTVYVGNGILTSDIAIAKTDNWADYVFEEGYQLMDLKEVEKFIKDHHHLPDIPSGPEVIDTGHYSAHELTVKLLKKVEELTLYTINQDKRIYQALEKLNEEK